MPPFFTNRLRKEDTGTHSLRRIKVAIVYKVKIFRPARFYWPHKIANMVREFRVDLDDALTLAECADIRRNPLAAQAFLAQNCASGLRKTATPGKCLVWAPKWGIQPTGRVPPKLSFVQLQQISWGELEWLACCKS